VPLAPAAFTAPLGLHPDLHRSRPDLQAAADELLDRLRAHTRRQLDDDVAVLLAEFTLTDTAVQPAASAQRPAGATVRAA